MKLRLCEHTVLLVLPSPMQDPQAGGALCSQNSLNPSLHVPFVSGSLGAWGDLVSPQWPRTPSPPALELSVLLSVWLLGAFVSASTGAAGTLHLHYSPGSISAESSKDLHLQPSG